MKDKEHRMHQAQCLRNRGLKQSQIAEILEVTVRTVRNYLNRPASPRNRGTRSSKLDKFKPFIGSILNEDPYYNCEILLDRLIPQGYTGKISILRDYVAKVRKKLVMEAVIRFETEPGRQAQVDWKEYRRTRPDGTKEKLYVFVMVMGYSRKPFVKFTTSMKQSVLLACHVEAFDFFGGVPHEILYDNMRTAFVCDAEGHWHPNKRLLAFANHYGFVPKRCRIRRPQTKGKVERAIGFMNANFWPVVHDNLWDLHALNEALQNWSNRICERELRDFGQTRRERFEHEKKHLLPLPHKHHDCRDVYEVGVSRETLILFETNRYSVPPDYIGQTVTLKVDPVNMVAEVFAGKVPIRSLKLEPKGSRAKDMRPEDKAALWALWKKQQEIRERRLKRKRTPGVVEDVELRSPAVYDKYSGEVA